MNDKTLNHISVGQRATVTSLTTQGAMRRRLCDIGLIPGTQVECLGRSPSGDPSAYLIRGAVIAIRQRDGQQIFVIPDGEVMPWD